MYKGTKVNLIRYAVLTLLLVGYFVMIFQAKITLGILLLVLWFSATIMLPKYTEKGIVNYQANLLQLKKNVWRSIAFMVLFIFFLAFGNSSSWIAVAVPIMTILLSVLWPIKK